MRRRWLLWALSARPRLFSSSSSSHSPSAAASTAVAVKRVTRGNFWAALEELRPLVHESEFVALDLEMTGVTSAPWRDAFEFDRPDVRYLKLKDSAEKFAVVQFGVCPFRWDPARAAFLAHPHNFYIFPRTELPFGGPSDEFLCQTTSIDFLAKYQFDFNACIHEGISYLSRAQETEALRILCSAYEDEVADFLNESKEHVEIPLVSTADLFFTERIKNIFHEWHNRILRSPAYDCPSEGEYDCFKVQFQTVFFKMHPAIMLNGFSSHQLKLIQLVLRKHFSDLVYVHADGEKHVIYTDCEEDKKALMKEVQEDLRRSAETKVKSAVGFRHVIDLLASEQKLIVGHNCILDMAHIYNKFFGSLPSTIVEFASSLHETFPHIVDTKHLLNVSHALQYLMKNKSRSLSSAFSLLCPTISSASRPSHSHSYVKIEVEADDKELSCWNPGAKHEAGYDAFMTGCVFAQACSHLGVKFELQSPSFDLARDKNLRSYINLLYPSWNSGTLIDLSTGIESPDSSYKHKYPGVVFANIVLVWGFPLKITPKDMKECICKVFGPDSITSIFFLDRTAALIQFSKVEFVNDFLILKDTLEKNNDPISVLHPLAKLLEGGNTCAADYELYKEICGASMSRVLFADQAEAVGIRWRTKVESGSSETMEIANTGDPTIEDALPHVKPLSGGKRDPRKQSHQISCEDILDSLYASKLLFGKRIRST